MDGGQAVALLGLVGPLGGAVVSAVVSFGVFVIHSRRKERKQRAVDLLEKLMVDPNMVKARLVAQEYLVENGRKYERSLDAETKSKLNFQQLDLKLAMSTDPGDNEARILIRTITSYFWLVNQAWENGQLSRGEKIFSEMYAWYWIFIIEARIDGCGDNRQFREFKWMSRDSDRAFSKMERQQMLQLPNSARLLFSPPRSLKAAGLPPDDERVDGQP